MHNVQKKAILAIISMIESGLREIRSVLVEPVAANGHTVMAAPRPEPAYGSPLDDEEERSLEQIMEKSRQDMLRSADSFYNTPPPTPLSQFFEGDDL